MRITTPFIGMDESGKEQFFELEAEYHPEDQSMVLHRVWVVDQDTLERTEGQEHLPFLLATYESEILMDVKEAHLERFDEFLANFVVFPEDESDLDWE